MELDSAPAEDRCSGTSSPQLEKIPKAGNLFGAFLKDQAWTCCAKRSFKEAYLNRRLSSCDSMYSCDIRGHHGCVNALAFSKSQEQFLASGKCLLIFPSSRLEFGYCFFITKKGTDANCMALHGTFKQH